MNNEVNKLNWTTSTTFHIALLKIWTLRAKRWKWYSVVSICSFHVQFEHRRFDAYKTWIHLLFVLIYFFLVCAEICKCIQTFSTLLYWWSLSKTEMFISMNASHIVLWPWVLYLYWFISVCSICICMYVQYTVCLCVPILRDICTAIIAISSCPHKSRVLFISIVLLRVLWTRAVVLSRVVE